MMNGSLPNLSAMPHDALHNHNRAAPTSATFDDLGNDELAEVVAQSLLDIPDPNLGPTANQTRQFHVALCERIRRWHEAVPVLARGNTGTAMLRPLMIMANRMRIDPVETTIGLNETAQQFVQRLNATLAARCRR